MRVLTLLDGLRRELIDGVQPEPDHDHRFRSYVNGLRLALGSIRSSLLPEGSLVISISCAFATSANALARSAPKLMVAGTEAFRRWEAIGPRTRSACLMGSEGDVVVRCVGSEVE